VLQEPKERVAENVVELVVHAPGGEDISSRYLLLGKRRSDIAVFGFPLGATIAFTHSIGHPGELKVLNQTVEGCDDGAAASPGLKLAFRAKVVLKGAPVAGNDEGALAKDVGAQLKELLLTCIFCDGYLHILPTPQVRPGTVWQTIRPLTFARGHSFGYLQ
jgi:hypothetical protein